MAKRALILKGGTMRGAFLVGALKTAHRVLGVNYFDAIFANSVGVFEQAFFAANQPDIMENTWREYVHGNQLINFLNLLKGKPILDLDYLIDLFQSDKSFLNIEALKSSRPQLLTFITDYENNEPILVDLKTGPVFDIMRATCALPIIYPKKVIINGRRYTDSWLVENKKMKEILREKLIEYDEVFAISAYRNDHIPKEVKYTLKPSRMPLWGALDTNRERIIKTIEQGERDMERFIIKNNLIKNL
ncbi:hypothetical protein A2732_00030 [Candidatus Nomurabacteria bacterium RIFCSPHIGHO2_01_FULL_40_10]|nr:MAG: hypothetical protein A2732_00030 [Candidatus Nomurabacteria bacterium RIFCSPHIGHO2_01_FULL_40_10]